MVVHAHDKLVFYGLLAGLGLPVPQTRALYQSEGRFAAVPAFAEPDALAAHLRAGMRYRSSASRLPASAASA